MKVRYIGNFPPPYGGVTIKNALLFDMLSQDLSVIRLKESKRIPKKLNHFINMLLALVSRVPLAIGVSAAGGTSRLLTRLLYVFNRRIMRKSLYFMMGGLEAKRIAGNPKEIEWYRSYRKIYVETKTMMQCLNDAGLTNVGWFPNCRHKPEKEMQVSDNRQQPLKCVFFSLIQPMKGTEEILAAAKQLPEVEFTFWGHISPEYREVFLSKIEKYPNAQYLGVFSGSNAEVFAELARHDVLLLPTKWKTEGVPGVLAEAKISGIPAIVSNLCYNAEIVEDGVNGVVLSENTENALAAAIAAYNADRELLYTHKKDALKSAEKYYAETYQVDILNHFTK